jgi:prepilin-type N-terminal cleavage/methylation domain-containing protein
MKKFTTRFGWRAFTLIELLIVVAIIAILAAIAVPNFLEAQTRAKVSRVLADMRSIKVGIESYVVDNNVYMETDTGGDLLNQVGFGLYRATTPIAYITSITGSPFTEANLGYPGWPNPTAPGINNAAQNGHFLYVRAQGFAGQGNVDGQGFDQSYKNDRLTYLTASTLTLANNETAISGFYMLKSVGPDNIDNRNGLDPEVANPLQARVYDPTNGTTSFGDIVTFQDTQIPADQIR